jgi:hypothetical protein
MRLMLVKEAGGRTMRCIDCCQPDPMKAIETDGWLRGLSGPT